jgi:hypothetical protein
VTSEEIEEDDDELLSDPDVIEEDDPALAQPDANEELAGSWIVPAPLSSTVDAIVPEDVEEIEPDAT